jgi:dethiobiotin synthetase
VNGGYFITGTDTGVGKTWLTVALMRHLQGQGQRVAAMKPVASDCRLTDGMLKNDDALLLQRYASMEIPYQLVNPYALELPIAPHIAAEKAGITIDFGVIGSAYRQLRQNSDMVLVEGIGGWMVPLSTALNVADLAAYMDLPVIIVVGIRLGCINHALLTCRAVLASAVRCAGWLASCLDPQMPALQENILALQKLLPVPLLGILPYNDAPGENENAVFLI